MKLISVIKVQLLLMVNKKSFKLAFLMSYVFCMLSYITNLVVLSKVDISMMYSGNTLFVGNSYDRYWNIFCAIYPFLLVFPFSFSYIEDLSVNNMPYFKGRMKNKYYFLGKMITCFIGGFIIIFIPFLLNLLLCNITFPNNNNTFYGYYNTPNYYRTLVGSNVMINTQQKGLIFLKLYLFSPFIYNLFYINILSIFTGLLSVVVLSFSFYLKKYKIILFIPVYLFFYLSKVVDNLSYHSKEYTNFNWMSYVCVDDFYGKNWNLFILSMGVMIMFSVISYIYICKKDSI